MTQYVTNIRIQSGWVSYVNVWTWINFISLVWFSHQEELETIVSNSVFRFNVYDEFWKKRWHLHGICLFTAASFGFFVIYCSVYRVASWLRHVCSLHFGGILEGWDQYSYVWNILSLETQEISQSIKSRWKIIKSTDSQDQNKQMVLHQTKKFLNSKGSNQQSKEATNREGENFAHYTIDMGLLSRIYKELQKNHNKINKLRNEQTFFKWPNPNR